MPMTSFVFLQQLKVTPRLIIGVLVLFHLVGLAGLMWPVSRSLFITLVPFHLLFSFSLMAWFHQPFSRRWLLVAGSIVVLGYLAEAIGVATGLVFGEYQYDRALGPKLFHTPPIIGLNWLMLVYASHELMKYLRMPKGFIPLAGATAMVLYDMALEPVAMQLEFWSWAGNVVPVQNYIAWFVLALLFHALMLIPEHKTRNPVAPALFVIQALFFALLYLFLA